MSYALREGLPPLPARMRNLRIEERGFCVPWFVEWIEGKPDFRVIDSAKWRKAVKFGNCWLCGEPQGRKRTYVLGPMCVINRTTSEPGCHLDCARFAVTACPFMLLPKAKRREANLPAHAPIAGYHLERNPGSMCLWTTERFRVFEANHGGMGYLIEVGDPIGVEWYAQGRTATRAEIDESVSTGMPNLMQLAEAQGADSVYALQAAMRRAERHFPQAQQG